VEGTSMMPGWKQEIQKQLAAARLEPPREAEIVEELAQHMESLYEELLADGVTPDQARRAILEEFAENDLLVEGLQRVERSAPTESFFLETRRQHMLGDLWQDLRYGARMLRKNPGFTAVAIVTLALGIGANTAIFSMINSVLIQPLPYPESDQLVQVFEAAPSFGRNSVSGGAFKDWREHSSKFAHLAISEGTQMNLTGDGTPERVAGLRVSAEFLPSLGITPILGRGFAAGEDTVGGNNQVIVLTYQFWQSHYGGQAGVIGKLVSLDQVPHTIIGVLPPRALLQDDRLFLVPNVIDAAGTFWGRSGHWRQVIGRLLPGVTPTEAQAQLREIKQQLTSQYPPFKEDWSVTVVPLQEVYAGDARPTLRILLGTVALVLLIACANVSNLLLARGNARAREMAIRAALGAHPWRIIRQMLVESLLLAVAGCLLGLLFAAFGINLLMNMFSGLLPQVLRPGLDVNVLLFSILVACGCGLLFGILPALRASRPDLNYDLKEAERGSTSGSRKRSQSFLVVSEFAFTLVLLIGAGLFLRSFIRLLEADPGFNPKQTLAFDLSFPKAKYPEANDRLRFVKDLHERIAALPGVESVGAVSSLPLSSRGETQMVSRTDRPARTDYVVGCDYVSGDYFPAMGIKLLRGRVITEADNLPTAPRVLVIDTGIARDLYADEEPLGRSLKLLGESWEIVGLVAPVRHRGLEGALPRVYGAQARSFVLTSMMVLRSSLPPSTLAAMARKTVLEADPDQPIANVRTLEQAVYDSLALRRATLILLGLFAFVAISLACIGIYGVMSYSVEQRARELCIRSALGAQRRDIIRLVLTGGMKLSIIGIVVGLAAALTLSRLVENLLFEVKTHDPLVFIASVCLLAMVALLSIYLPARRAARLDPIVALRSE
jgi:putative ABC transport system permease protein